MLDNLQQVYRYRALVVALVGRHLATRYRGSVLGFLWSLLNPLCLMLVYTLVFRFYLRFQGVENYSLFLFCGLLPWIWLTSSLSEGVHAVVSSGHLITKSMFPAQILPIVAAISSFINFLLSLPILFIFILVAGLPIHATLVFLPLLCIFQFILSLGISLALSALNVRFRDVQHLLANALTFLFFLCPIVYPATSVPEKFQFTMALNPFALLTSFYHDLILNGVVPSLEQVLYLAAWSMVAFVIGNMIFDSNKEGFAELL